VAGSVNCLVGAVKVFRPRDRGARLAQRCRRLGPGPVAMTCRAGTSLSFRPAGRFVSAARSVAAEPGERDGRGGL